MKAYPRPSGSWNQARGTSSIQYEVARNEGLSSSIRYEESSKQDFIRPVRSRTKGEHVLVLHVRGIKQVGLHSSDKKSCKESLSTFVRYEELSRWDFARPVHSRAKRGHVVVRLVRGIKYVGLHPSSTKLLKRWACPHPFGMRNQVGWTSSVRYEFA